MSFAPEATLHTWDVIEYMRDATASSSASSNGRLSFAPPPARQSWEQESDPPSTPPEQADDDGYLPGEPEHQRDVHQKKRRRSSAIPPMNFNNPDDDDFSSSPASGSSMVDEGSSDMESGNDDEEDDEGEEDGDEYESEDDGESTAMSLDAADDTVRSEETESTDSSLTARLRQASDLAGTRGIVYDEHGEEYRDGDEAEEEEVVDDEEYHDENGDQTMEMVTQDVTNAFKPWANQQNYGPPPMAKNIIALQDQENINPFSPAFRHAYSHRKPQGVPSTVGELTEMMDSEDMSMDMTRAVGGILQSNHAGVQYQADDDDDDDDDNDDLSMDMTRAVGGILLSQQSQQQSRAQEVEQDESEGNDMTMDMTQAIGGILQPQHHDPQVTPSQPDVHEEVEDDSDDHDDNDVSMDMTRAVGGILPAQQPQEQARDHDDDHTGSLEDQTMDFTQAIGRILQQSANRLAPPRSALKRKHTSANDGSPMTDDTAPQEPPQRRTAAQATAKRRRSSAVRASLGDATMDFTVAMGGIKPGASPVKQDRRSSLRRRRSSANSSVMDEQTMDLTTAIGGIRQQSNLPVIQHPIDEEQEIASPNVDMFTESTAVVGDIVSQEAISETHRPSTPRDFLSPTRTEVPTTPNHEGHFREAKDRSAKKLLTPLFECQVQQSAVKDSAGSGMSSTRKSVGFAEKSPSSARKSSALSRKTASPHGSTPLAVKSPASSRKTPPAAITSPARAQQSPSLVSKSPVTARQSTRSASKSPRSVPNAPSSARKSHLSVIDSAAPVHRSPASARKSPASARRRRPSVAPGNSVLEDTPEAGETPLFADEVTASFSPVRDTEMNTAPTEEIVYPTLPTPETLHVAVASGSESATTPAKTSLERVTTPQPQNHRMVSEAGSPMATSIHTPEQIDMDIVDPCSPITEKQLRSSPIKIASTTPQQPVIEKAHVVGTSRQTPMMHTAGVITPQRSTAQALPSFALQPTMILEDPSQAFANSLKAMSTPRKDTGTSPLKRLRGMTPMKSPAKKAMTPRKIATPKAKTPRLQPKNSAAELAGHQLAQELFAAANSGQMIPKVKLNDFLDKAGIKFMELALPTKRRFTVAPNSLSRETTSDAEADTPIDLESAVVAGACTMPMLDLFQHSCRELKRYISEGKAFIKTLESDVYADTPPLISAYTSASPQRKAQLDTHLRDVKTNARLRSKEVWYEWRSKLLDGLEDGLAKIKSGLDEDAKVLHDREQLLDTLLPDLLIKHESLQARAIRLEEAAATTSESEKEELDNARRALSAVNAEIEERKRILEDYKQDVQEQDHFLNSYAEARVENLAQIAEADRVKESCRGWTTDEVTSLRASVSALESQTGWKIDSAAGTKLTMIYRSTLSLFFDTAAFANSASAAKSGNQPISLTYIGNSDDLRPQHQRPLTTEKRFFLQLLRAQLQCLEQRDTRIKTLLEFVSKGWDVATSVSESIRGLRLEHPVAVAILSDERLGVMADVLLPKVQTKVRVTFEIGAGIEVSEEGAMDVQTSVGVSGKVVYGEAYNEKNMEGFLGRRCGGLGEGWVEGVRELRVKLVATGRKGRA